MNYYEILGVGPKATEQEIKEAYRREAMKWHPDRHDGATAKAEADRRFKDLAVAYRTLRDSSARINYDRQLEQQLRREFEARQQEQARQQRAQSEQAFKEQSKAKQPGADFADTQSPFEDDTTSSAEANQMFYEQMLDLAFELAGRGFPEFNILKALVALGCPEALAKAVAATAAKQGHGKYDKAASNSHDASFTSPELNAEFVVKPKRYVALLGATFGFWLIFKCISDWSSLNSVWHVLIQILGVLFGARLLIHWGQVSIANSLMIIDHQGIRFSRGGGKITKWDEVQTYSFDGKKLKIGGIKNGKKWEEQLAKMFVAGDCQEIISRISRFKKGTDWDIHSPTTPIENRLPLASMMLTGFIVVALIGLLAAIALPAYQDYTRRAEVATGFIHGSEAANKVGNYYATQQRGPDDLVKAGFSLVPSKTVRDITFNNQTGVLTILFQDGFFNDKSLLLVPDVVDKKLVWLCTSDGVAKQYLPPACTATQDAANERLATIKSETVAKEQAKAEYAQAVAAVEQQYPELNPDSPSQNQQAMDWVLARKAAYEKRGSTATNALQSAVVDYGAALQQQRSQAYPAGEISNSTQQVRSTGGISQSEANSTICQTWPSACR